MLKEHDEFYEEYVKELYNMISCTLEEKDGFYYEWMESMARNDLTAFSLYIEALYRSIGITDAENNCIYVQPCDGYAYSIVDLDMTLLNLERTLEVIVNGTDDEGPETSH